MPTPTPVEHLVVVGASLAGLRAVEGARESGFTGRVTLVGAETHLPYDRPPLSKAVLVLPEPPSDLTFVSQESLIGELGVDLLLGRAATGLDTQRRTVALDGDGLVYDALVIATGSSPRLLPVDHPPHGVMSLRTVDDALALRQAMRTARHITVVGAGFVGAEAASVAHAQGTPVTIVEAAEVPLARAVGREMGAALADMHTRRGMDLRCGTSVTAVHGEESVESVSLSDGAVLETDLVLVGIGSSPCTEWLSGGEVALADGVVCDEFLASTAPGVYAAGDVASWPNQTLGRRMRLENWTAAAEMGRVAGSNAAGCADPQAYSTVPYFWSDWYGERIQFVGSADGDEVCVVSGSTSASRFAALYRRADRLVGALTVNLPAHTMKYRALIGRGGDWPSALALAAQRNARDPGLATLVLPD